MKGFNQITIFGTLGRDPELRATADGVSVTTMSLATSEEWTNKQTGQKTEHTEWHRAVLYGRMAEVAGEYLRKGSTCLVSGRIKTKKWQDKQTGQDRYSTEIIVDSLQFQPRSTGGSEQSAFDSSQSFQQQAAFHPRQEQARKRGVPAQPSQEFDSFDDSIPF